MEKHYILGLDKRAGGAFEHSWNLAKNLMDRGYTTEYFSHWWDMSPRKVSFNNWHSVPLDVNDLKKMEGIFHLQTHIWENSGHLDSIVNDSSKIVYNLHSIIPYYYLKEDDKISFLEGNLSMEKYESVIKGMSNREKSQLDAMKKADYLFVLAEGHKKILQKMNLDKSIHIFENISDVDIKNKDFLEECKLSGQKFRDNLNVSNVILYCGRLYEKKGSIGLFDTFSKIKGVYGSSKLILLGSGEDMADKFFKYGLKKEDLEDIVFVPWIDKNTPCANKEFLKYYYSSDVLIQPMITEGLFSKAVVDAMAIGLPVITCKSLYTIGTSKNSSEIFNSFVQFKENPWEVKKIVSSAKLKVENENTWDSYIHRLNNVLNI